MSSRPPIRFTAGPEQHPAGFREDASTFKPLLEGTSKVTAIAPDSISWQELHAGKRFEIAPFLETLVRAEKASLAFTEQATSTCQEKAAAAGIIVEATVKALYCKDVFSGEKFLLVVSGKGRVSLSGILSEVHDYAQLDMCAASELPPGMEFGTCSAFISPQALAGVEMVAIEDPLTKIRGKKGRELGVLGDLEADFSIGGTDSTAHHLSVRMRYADFVDALLSEYGEKAKIISDIKRT